MLKIGIIVGSTRPGPKAAAVAKWVYDILKARQGADFEIVDLEDYKLPLLDEPAPPRMHQYSKPHTKAWSEKIAIPRRGTFPLKKVITFSFGSSGDETGV